jgi:hypothetical protein
MAIDFLLKTTRDSVTFLISDEYHLPEKQWQQGWLQIIVVDKPLRRQINIRKIVNDNSSEKG